MSRGTLPGWPLLLAAAVLIYGPKLVYDIGCFIYDQLRAIDDDLASVWGQEELVNCFATPGVHAIDCRLHEED